MQSKETFTACNEACSADVLDELICVRHVLGITCVAVCCSVLQCVAECDTVCVAACVAVCVAVCVVV